MTEASFPTVGRVRSQAVSDGERRPRRLSTLLLEALHHSRRLQAKRILGQYRHLIAEIDPRAVSDTLTPKDH